MRQQQAELFLYFVGFGIACGLVYDLLRAFRREVRHGIAAVTIEDTILGATVCIGCYGLFLWKNRGALRSFGFIGLFCGAALYFLTVSPWVVVCMRWCIRVLLFPIKWLFSQYKRLRKAGKRAEKKLTNPHG